MNSRRDTLDAGRAPQEPAWDWKAATVASGASLLCGYFLVQTALPLVHDHYLPWIVARACGLSAYAALFLLVALGMWLRHPWRTRFAWPHAETQLRVHAGAGIACVALVAGHVVALALDRWAGVGWLGTVVPLKATYRPWPVAIGVVSCYALAALVLTARFGGRLVGRHWLAVHRLALPTMALVWFHGVLAGTDTPRLRLFYAASGLVVAGLAATRWFAKPIAARRTGAVPAPRAAARSR